MSSQKKVEIIFTDFERLHLDIIKICVINIYCSTHGQYRYTFFTD